MRELLVVHPRNARAALDAARALHAAGTAFDVELQIEHPGITVALRTCAGFERRYPDIDARRAAYDDLEYRFKLDIHPRDVAALRSLSRNARALMRDVIVLAAGVRVRSWEEVGMLQSVFEVPIEAVFVPPVVPALPPVAENGRRDAIVVWAPHLVAGDCALYAAALEDARMSAFIVGASGDRVPGTAQFVTIEHAGDILGRAAVIVDATTTEPGWAIALATLGRPMAVSMSSGAHAYLDHVVRFRPWMRGDIALAVAHAMGAPAPVLRPPASRAVPLSRTMRTVTATAAGAARALADAVALRERAEPFAVLLDLGQPYADAAAAMATGFIEKNAGVDAQAHAYDTFAAGERNERGDAAPSVITIPPPVLETLRQCAVLADRVVSRSHTESFRNANLLQLYDRPVSLIAPRDGTVPAPQKREPDGRIVVWAPNVPPFALGVVRIALAGIDRAVTTIDAQSSADAMREALVRAAVVVCPAHDHAGAAVALAAWGMPLAASVSSGVEETLTGVSLYVPTDRTSVRDAILAAFGMPAPVPRVPSLPPLAADGDPAATGAPRVALIVRVRDGSEGLERTRLSLALQRYPHIDVVETSGGGTRIVRNVNAAIRKAADAAYIAVIDAGDELFPDHVATLVGALERSGRHVAYAETLIAHVQPDARIAGYSLVTRRPIEVAPMNVRDGLLAAPLRSLMRRDELIEAGLWNEHLPNAGDHELFLRLRKRADFVYVPRVTSRTRRPRAAALRPHTGALPAEHRLLHLLHPVPGRPALDEQRKEVLAFLNTGREFNLAPPPMRLG